MFEQYQIESNWFRCIERNEEHHVNSEQISLRWLTVHPHLQLIVESSRFPHKKISDNDKYMYICVYVCVYI